jgi:hypothetical protein
MGPCVIAITKGNTTEQLLFGKNLALNLALAQILIGDVNRAKASLVI